MQVAVEPECWRKSTLVRAVEQGGGTIVPAAGAEALVWADPASGHKIRDMLHPNMSWVQLPYAGIENMLTSLDTNRLWTCGKGVYAKPVAEMVLAMALSGFRHLQGYSRARTWSEPVGQNLTGANVLVLGAGGITVELLKLLVPFDTTNTVLRRQAAPLPGADHTGTLDELHGYLPNADLVVLALAVTPETTGVIGQTELDLMAEHAWLINVARGVHIDTAALCETLAAGGIGGAALDVTDPEPLPDGHRLWELDNCFITPHVGNTPQMGLELLAERVTDNVRRRIDGAELMGTVDVTLGY